MTWRATDRDEEAEHWAQQARSPLWQDQDADVWRASVAAGLKAAVVIAAALVVVTAGFHL